MGVYGDEGGGLGMVEKALDSKAIYAGTSVGLRHWEMK